MAKKGKENPNWRGGRIKASHGYIKIRLGRDHHLTDATGYAYEHRYVAEQKLGRRLMPGEMVHHKNGDKADNRPENIEICRNHFEHKVHHRTTEGMRLPGEPNPIIECECGCGKTFKKYDPSNRPRRFVSGHNPPPPATAMDAVLEILKRGSAHRQVIADLCGKPVKNVGVALDRLRVKGLVIRVDRGVWALWEKNQK